MTAITRRRGRNKVASFIGIAAFIVIVIISGIGLSATNNIENPFTVFNQVFSQSATSGEQRAFAGNTQQRPPEGGGARDGGSGSALQIGGVLFNIWYLLATTAVVILVQKSSGFIIRLLRWSKPSIVQPRQVSST